MGSVGSSKAQEKPHAVCIPFPAQGHITPMLHLAKLLHQSGFQITFVNTVYNHNRLVRTGGEASVQGLPDFRFEKIPDGLPDLDDDVTQDIPSLCLSISKNCLEPFQGLLAELEEDGLEVTCLVCDIGMSFAVDAAKELDVPVVCMGIASASAIMGYALSPMLIENGLVPIKDERSLETIIEHIPGEGMKGVRLKDLPSILHTTKSDDIMLNAIVHDMKKASGSDGIIINTFEALEHDVLTGLLQMFPSVLPIGPLHVLSDQIPKNYPVSSIGSSLWKGEVECVNWLSTQGPKSVLYVNYGSIAVLSPEQLLEFGWGLANSGHAFLWIIRPDLVNGEKSVLPPDFLEEIKGRGFLASWCPQEQVLTHPAIGGFLTHCGWNSTIESMAAGVPLLCWPFAADQMTNCWSACNEWGVGMEIDKNVKRDKVEKLVRELMEGERGMEMRRRAVEWKMLGDEAVGPAGSSTLNLEKLVKQVLLSKMTRKMILRQVPPSVPSEGILTEPPAFIHLISPESSIAEKSSI